jgi:hypothetical protein
MKKITLSTGEIRLGYDYSELNQAARKKAIENTSDYLADIAESEKEAMNARDAKNILYFISASKYLFDMDGNLSDDTHF